MLSLDQLALGQWAEIVAIDDQAPLKRRLQDLGFTKGAAVCPLARAWSGDPTAYWIRGGVIALRGNDAVFIGVQLKEGQGHDAIRL